MLLDEQGPQRHPKMLVGLGEAEPAQVQLLLRAVDLPGELVDGAAERRGQVLAERRHDAPQHVVVEDPEKQQHFHPTRQDFTVSAALFFIHLFFLHLDIKKLVKPVICWCGSDVSERVDEDGTITVNDENRFRSARSTFRLPSVLGSMKTTTRKRHVEVNKTQYSF